jgi:GWxTD domain-containing protein
MRAMKYTKKSLIYWVSALLALFFLAGEVQGAKSQLPPRYQKWLEEEVVYIISPREKDVFEKLGTDRERDLFIEAFWKHRDPNPASPENEFKTEHFRRLTYANKYLGRSSPLPGWRTDRGRIYIILGEPNDIQRYEGKSEVYPTEVWFYQGKTEQGLPAGFNIVFFKESGSGDYKLYSPMRDGPQALLTTYQGDPSNYLSAYQELREVDPTLASVSLSLVPGEESAAFGRPSLSSDLLIQKVESLPSRLIEDRYAQKFLQYKDVVEVEYTANYIDNDSLVKVLRDPSGICFVHYVLEPKKLSVNQYNDKYYTTLALNGTVSNSEGKTIFQYDKKVSLELTEEQMGNASRQPFDIHDMFPLIPGHYKFSLLMKNEVSKEFTSLEQNLDVPEVSQASEIGSLILGYKVAKTEDESKKLKPFKFGAYQLYAQPNRVFIQKEPLVLAFQVQGLTPDLKGRGEVKYVFQKEDKEFLTVSKKVAEYSDGSAIIQDFSLADFPPFHYRIQVSLVLDGKEIAVKSDEFDVTHLAGISRPWIYSRILPDASDPFYVYLLGVQNYNSGKMGEAKENLEQAFREKPESPEIALNLARTYTSLGEHEKVELILTPFIKAAQTPRYEIYSLLGQSFVSRGQWEKAVGLFDQAMTHYGVNSNILNLLGHCYNQMGKTEEALQAWQKSLEINPQQPQVQQAVKSLKEKK